MRDIRAPVVAELTGHAPPGNAQGYLRRPRDGLEKPTGHAGCAPLPAVRLCCMLEWAELYVGCAGGEMSGIGRGMILAGIAVGISMIIGGPLWLCYTIGLGLMAFEELA